MPKHATTAGTNQCLFMRPPARKFPYS